jgi:DNA-binding MarR family transcriptional regulator
MAFADLRHHLPLVMVVTERPGVTVNELARVMRMPKSQVSVRITRLAERGIVRREPDAHDSRLVRLRVTDEGCRHARDWQAAHHQALVRTLQPLSEAELAQIVDGLGLLFSALQRQGGCEGEGGMHGCSSDY